MDYRHSHPDHHSRALTRLLHSLPKIDLHRHLEGSLRLSTMAAIAGDCGLELPGAQVEQFRHLVQVVPEDRRHADVFMSKFGTLREFYRSPEAIERVAYEAVADAAADNVVYLELLFTPAALARKMGFALEDVTAWVIGAVERAQADFDIDVRLLVTINRHESVELGEQQVEIAIANRERGVVGVNLAGAENHYSGAPFADVFRRARAAGLHTAIHAGEWAGAESIAEALDVLGAERLGHGVRVLESDRLVAEARARGITFEVCPTSNVQSGVAPSYEAHPLGAMVRAGLRTTINTDDPSVSGIDLTDEYAHAVEEMGLSLADLKQCLLNAAHAAFLPDAERAALVARIRAALSDLPLS